MMPRSGRGTHRIPLSGPTAVAARATSAAPAGTGCSTALLLSKAVILASLGDSGRTLQNRPRLVVDLLRCMSLLLTESGHAALGALLGV